MLREADSSAASAPSPTATPAREVVVPSRPPLLPSRVNALAPTPQGLSAVLARALRNPALGGRIAAAVVDARTGQVLLDIRGSASVTPASTSKIATAVAALSVLDPDARLPTRVVAGTRPGQVVVIGGGDPTLASAPGAGRRPVRATLADLARQVRAALGPRSVTSVLVDASLFSGPVLGPGWKPSYVTGGDVAPVTALMVDDGQIGENGPRSRTPALTAGRKFAAALGVPGAPVMQGRAGPGARVLGVVQSPTIVQLVEQMLRTSDNDTAEALARQVALAGGVPASFAGAAAAIDAALKRVLPDVQPDDFELNDGSGLSRTSRLQPLALARLLSAVVTDQTGRLRPVLSALPVAGFSGTLSERFRKGATAVAAGDVRGKTGTLNGVSALAGVLRTADGRLLAFDFTADAVPPGANNAAEQALDALAASIASCGCR